MDQHARAGAVQRPGDLGADAPRAPGDEDHFAVERRKLRCRHATERYRIVRPAGTRRAGHGAEPPRVRAAAASARRNSSTRQDARAAPGEIRAAGGWIGFERYMEIALYAPGLGYYSAGARKLGPGRRFHHGAGDLAPVRRMPREAVRRGARAARGRLDPRDRRRDRRAGGGHPGAARDTRTGCRHTI